MRKLLILFLFLLCCGTAFAQQDRVRQVATDPSGSCGYPQNMQNNYVNNKLWECGTDGMWHQSNVGGGTGTVTSVALSCPAAGPVTTTGTMALSEPVNAQTGASYAILAGDCGKAITGANSGAQAYSIAQAGTTGFPAGYFFDIRASGAGTITITPTTSTINGAATLVLTTTQSARVISDGVNYIALTGGSGGTPGGSNTQVQYNNSGAFGGITNLTSNGTNPFLTAIAAPSTPSAGFGVLYVDSTSKNLAVKDDAGVVKHGIQDVTCTNQFVSAVSAAGVSTCSDLQTKYKTLSCQPGLGDGLNAITSGTYLQSACLNAFGSTWTIVGVSCFTDNNGTSTVNVTNGAGTALLTGAITCTNSFAAGTQSGTTTIASTDFSKWTFVADGTSKQTTWTLTVTY